MSGEKNCIVCGIPISSRAGWSACLRHRQTKTMEAPEPSPTAFTGGSLDLDFRLTTLEAALAGAEASKAKMREIYRRRIEQLNRHIRRLKGEDTLAAEALEWFREKGIIFDGRGGHWESVAFALYGKMVQAAGPGRGPVAKDGREG